MKQKVMRLFIVVGIIMTIYTGCGEMESTGTESFAEYEDSIETEESSAIVENIIAEEVTVEESTESVPTYTYADIGGTKYAKSSVNVRDLPSKKGNKLGTLAQNESVSITGQCIETNWYRIDYRGGIGYVSNNYLVDEKTVVEVVSSEQSSVGESVSNNSDGKNNASSNNNQGGGASVTVPDHEETVGNLVWVPTKGGKKYHSKSSCSNMEDPMQVTLETAIANGYTACKRCY